MWVEVEVCAIDLVKSPEKVFGRAIDVGPAGIVREIRGQRRTSELFLEEIDFVQEKHDAGSHKPSRVDDRVE